MGTGTVERCGRDVARCLSSGDNAAEKMNVVDDLRFHTLGPDVHTGDDWSVPRADKLHRVQAALPSIVGWIKFESSYIGWPVGGDANRPDWLHVIAGPEFETC